MDGLLALLALVALALPVGVIVLFVMMTGARDRLRKLEDTTAQLLAEVKRLRALSPPEDAAETVVAPVARLDQAPAVVETAPEAPAAAPPPAPDQNQPLVIRPDRFAAALRWLQANWVYAVAAASLALAGVFFVQYGIEKGLLPPPARVAAAIAFGLALIGAGEWLRRRWGEGEGTAPDYLPAVFSGAGIVAVFAGIAAGRLIYGLYGPGVTFAGLVLAAAGAVVLGWRHGPLLVAVGLLGAAATPFLVEGGGGAPVWLYGHYLLVAALGLAVDAVRRWAWVSVLALVLAHLGLVAVNLGGAGEAGWLWSLLALALLGVIIPQRALVPDHSGPSVTRALWRRNGVWPSFPVWLAAGNMVAVTAGMVLVGLGAGEALLAFLLLAALALLLLIWASKAEGLEDLALLPAAGFLAKLALAEPLIRAFRDQAIALRAPETSAPGTVSLLLALATAISVAAGWRSLRGGSLPHALAAILIAPLAVCVLDFLWQPGAVLGDYLWALHVMALAAGIVALAVAFARADGQPGRRTAWATLSALSLIALAMFLVTSAAALTLALAVLLVTAVVLDRRFDLPEMGWFVQAAAAVLSYRLIADPGIDWADVAPLAPVLASYLGVAGACAAGLRLMPAGRMLTRAVLESLGLAALALLVNVLILRALRPAVPDSLQPDWSLSHWGAALHALPWLILAGTQLWRAGVAEGFARKLRLGIAAVAGVLAAGGLGLAVTLFNPLFSGWQDDPTGLVRGPVLLDSLFLAYALPGALLVLLPRRLSVLPVRLAQVLQLVGIALLTLYAGEEIRRLWQGRWIGGPGVMQGELYSYTLALLLTGAVLLWQALARRSLTLRRVAMAVIALTVVKVFLWDASGLSGLVRVVSFAGLGLSLAGLAWLNRWADRAMSEQRDRA